VLPAQESVGRPRLYCGQPCRQRAYEQRAVDLGGRVVIASYLLAPGFFHDQLAKAGADLVTAPLLPSPVLAGIALERYDAALAARAPRE
jgi:hypothetical protein